MRSRFLTVYDYGTGGVWQYITADSIEQITTKYPKLTVLVEPPAWWSERPIQNLRTYDIDAEPTDFLKSLAEGKG